MIVSYYSYKGGVGRSQMCANIATYLSKKKGQKVLLWDWDFEAPGLHFYFGKQNSDINVPGTIDMFDDYCAMMRTKDKVSTDDFKFINPDSIINLSQNAQNEGRIDLLACGNYAEDFSTKLYTFNWYEFYNLLQGKTYIEYLKEWIKQSLDYDFILIDSRTGISEYSGICNLHLPDANVIVMAANHQNINGCKRISDKVLSSDYRNKDNKVPYVFPVLSRINVNGIGDARYVEWINRFSEVYNECLVNLDIDFVKDEYKNFSKDIFADIYLAKTLLGDDPTLSAGENVLFTDNEQEYTPGTLIYKYLSFAEYLLKLKKNASIGILDDIDKSTWIRFSEQAGVAGNIEKQKIANQFIAKFDKKLSSDNSGIGANIDEFNKLMNEGKPELAIEVLNDSIKNENGNESLIVHANLLFSTKNYQEAIKAYLNLIQSEEHEERKGLMLYNIGVCYEAIGNYEEAITYFNAHQQINAHLEGTNADYYIGFCYYKLGNYQNALAFFLEYEKQNSEVYFVKHNIGNVYYRLGDLTKAGNYYKSALKLQDVTNETYYNLALVYKQLDRYDKALRILNKGLLVFGDNYYLLHLKGICYLNLGKTDKAIVLYQSILKNRQLLSSSFGIEADTHNNLGFAYLINNDFEQSKNCFKTAFAQGEKKHSLFNQGSRYLRLDKWEEAIAYYSESYRAFPTEESFYSEMEEDFKLLKIEDYENEIHEIAIALEKKLPEFARINKSVSHEIIHAQMDSNSNAEIDIKMNSVEVGLYRTQPALK